MTNPRERLAMLHGHILHRNESEIQPMFPMLSVNERNQFFAQRVSPPNIRMKSTHQFGANNLKSELKAPRTFHNTSLISPKNLIRLDDNEAISRGLTKQIESLYQISGLNNRQLIVDEDTNSWTKIVSKALENPSEQVLLITSGDVSDFVNKCKAEFDNFHSKFMVFKVKSGHKLDRYLLQDILTSQKFSLAIITHTNMNIGIQLDIKRINEIIGKVSPKTLRGVDVSSSIGAQAIEPEQWKSDVVFGEMKTISIIYLSGTFIERFGHIESKKMDTDKLSQLFGELKRIIGDEESISTLDIKLQQYKLITNTVYEYLQNFFEILPELSRYRTNCICSFKIAEKDFERNSEAIEKLGISVNKGFLKDIDSHFLAFDFRDFELTYDENGVELEELLEAFENNYLEMS
ncbi:hypothetical protein HYPBUDRAFT_147292 [Hyphopichia burtonii NRRL Y-1933]|uniref:Uncharacterized protein n=1 Tax=Hyphopichia burtonii NRRL Y-1933 TaxID=984485 RepID=A0A1E4RN96_9ASCO|nr:hypothetical protein HYPBUDRAFT_147292 [Hyphopichia burtonii NRRL Y-1933]ODV68754.1 hypothetical protein HYPBUDRAFT_147292 [Hyphopichia burtonii NRRL Y-1933]